MPLKVPYLLWHGDNLAAIKDLNVVFLMYTSRVLCLCTQSSFKVSFTTTSAYSSIELVRMHSAHCRISQQLRQKQKLQIGAVAFVVNLNRGWFPYYLAWLVSTEKHLPPEKTNSYLKTASEFSGRILRFQVADVCFSTEALPSITCAEYFFFSELLSISHWRY